MASQSPGREEESKGIPGLPTGKAKPCPGEDRCSTKAGGARSPPGEGGSYKATRGQWSFQELQKLLIFLFLGKRNKIT